MIDLITDLKRDCTGLQNVLLSSASIDGASYIVIAISVTQ